MLTNSLWKAFSGISVAQKGIDVTSSNITNANTPGYTKKTANQISQVLNPWQGGEVAIANITRTIDAALQKQLRGSLSDLGSAQAVNDILQRADTLFGNTTANSDLTAQLTKLSTLLQSVALQPNDATHNTNFIMTAQAVLRQINSAETSLQELRKDADARLDASVDELNAALDKISLLNKKILAATADGKPSGDLEDQRDIEIETVAKKLDIVIMPRDRNGIAVYTKSGYMLFDQEVRRLAYTPTSTVDATTRYDLGGFSGITIPASSIPTDLTSTLRNGELKG
ncbi:MAG: flagellar hook-associated protein FlgK, partial [Holosporales bacterium]